jgi:hypothetical protein
MELSWTTSNVISTINNIFNSKFFFLNLRTYTALIFIFCCRPLSCYCWPFCTKEIAIWVQLWSNKPTMMSNCVQNYNFFSYMPMWCYFNGILIMASCALWLLWMLKNLNWIIGPFDFGFWFEHISFKGKHVPYQTLLISQRGSWFYDIQNFWCLIFW